MHHSGNQRCTLGLWVPSPTTSMCTPGRGFFKRVTYAQLDYCRLRTGSPCLFTGVRGTLIHIYLSLGFWVFPSLPALSLCFGFLGFPFPSLPPPPSPPPPFPPSPSPSYHHCGSPWITVWRPHFAPWSTPCTPHVPTALVQSSPSSMVLHPQQRARSRWCRQLCGHHRPCTLLHFWVIGIATNIGSRPRLSMCIAASAVRPTLTSRMRVAVVELRVQV